MAKRSIWARWFGWLFPENKANPRSRIPRQDTLARRLDSAVRGSKERDLLRGAEESLKRGRRDEAMRAYRAALGVFMDRGAYQKAVAVLTSLSRLQPNDPSILEELASVHEQLGRRAEASAARQRAAAMYEAGGASDRASELRRPSTGSEDGRERLHFHHRHRGPSSSPEAPVEAGIAAPAGRRPFSVPPAETNGALDLGSFEYPDDASDVEEPDPTLGQRVTEQEGPLDPTEAMPAVSPAQVRSRPVLEEPERPAFEPLAPGVPPTKTDPSELFVAQTQAVSRNDWGDFPQVERAASPGERSRVQHPDAALAFGSAGGTSPARQQAGSSGVQQAEGAQRGKAERSPGDLDLPGASTLSPEDLPPLPAATGEEGDEDEEAARSEGDQTIWDPSFIDHVEAAKKRAAQMHAAEPPGYRPPTRTGGPRGLSIPNSSTVLDPRGAASLKGSEHDPKRPRPRAPSRNRRTPTGDI